MSKTLLTGGAGFVGSNLAELIESSILLDWRNPGYLFEEDPSCTDIVFDDCEFVHGDIRKNEDLEKCSDFGEIGSIIHLAAIPGIKKCEENPELAESVNVDGIENILEFTRKHDIPKIVFASSAGVYGEIEEHPITENHPVGPLNLYSRTKADGEKVLKEYSKKYGIEVTVMRMSNLYGPNFQVKPNLTVIPIFILNSILNKPLTIYGDGEQTRDFVHVKDVAQAFRKALESSSKSFRVYNLGSGETTSINKLAETIRKLMKNLYDREVEMNHVEMPEWREEAKEKFDYSIQKIREELDYEPEFSIEQGLRELLENSF